MATVLVVDDDPLHRDVLATMLERGGFAVLTAEDGNECIATLCHGNVDLIITDIFMPQKDGLELCAELRSSEPGIPIISMTGGGSLRVVRPYERLLDVLGVREVLKKPIGSATLLRAVNDAIGSKDDNSSTIETKD